MYGQILLNLSKEFIYLIIYRRNNKYGQQLFTNFLIVTCYLLLPAFLGLYNSEGYIFVSQKKCKKFVCDFSFSYLCCKNTESLLKSKKYRNLWRFDVGPLQVRCKSVVSPFAENGL